MPEGRQVFPELSVIDNLRLGAYARTSADEAKMIDALLDRFPALKARQRQRAGLLSGGEQQMLAIARGLMARPEVLMLDEPSLGLAPQTSGNVSMTCSRSCARRERPSFLSIRWRRSRCRLPIGPMCCNPAASGIRARRTRSARTRRWCGPIWAIAAPCCDRDIEYQTRKPWTSFSGTRDAIGAEHELTDIGIAGGKIAAIEPGLAAEGETIDLGGRLVSPGFVETHIHLDKSCILDRCKSERGDLEEAIAEAAKAKAAFTPEDVHARATRTLEKAILQGTTHMRTHLEVDPGVGLRGLEGVLPLIKQYAWAIDLQICVFPQEGLLNNPGTDELMVEALDRGCRAIGGAPYTDSNPPGQIDRIFELARDYDIDIDMHLDFGPTAEGMDLEHVCRRTEEFQYGGRVAIGHVTKAASLSMPAFDAMAKRLADAGVALTVLPSTDLYLMGRQHKHDHNVTRGVVPAHKLLQHGVNCSLSSNNILNPFTPFGDCSQMRMANLYANICQVGKQADMRECFNMVTRRPAEMMRLKDYGLAVGKSADLVVLDSTSPEMAVAELTPVLYAFKRGRKTVSRQPAILHRPQ